MNALAKQVDDFIKRARVKEGTVTLKEVSAFVEDADITVEELFAKLEEAGIEVSESRKKNSGSGSSSKTPLQIYFDEISQIDLLDPEEEIQFSKEIQKHRDKIEALCDEYGVSDEPRDTIVKGTNNEIIRERLREEGITGNQLSGFMQRLNRHKENYLDAHAAMVEANLRLVVSIAKKYRHCGLSLDDLINEGNMGLMKAVDRYDYSKGYRFSTYAVWWIRQSVLRAISNKGRTIRLPVYMNDLIRKWNQKKEQLQQELGREPHMMEVADELNIDYEKAIHIMRHSKAPTSLEAPVGDNEEAELKEMIESNSRRDTEFQVDEEMMREKLWEVIDEQLTEKEQFVFVHRYGLNQTEEKTLEEVGDELDLTRERIRQIQEAALEKVRNSPQGEDLKQFLISLTT